jgi:hypothetical protein
VWYLLKVDALIAMFVFVPAGLFILALFAWQEAKAFAAARHRIFQRLLTLTTDPRFFANPFAISRSVSRAKSPDQLRSARFQ